MALFILALIYVFAAMSIIFCSDWMLIVGAAIVFTLIIKLELNRHV